ncbi:MAG: class I tRNA ligase family protein, partial [Elioraea tepidiphila]
ESLSLFMYQNPKSAKRLYFDVIPRNVDDYLTFVEKYPAQDEKARLMNPAWHIHAGNPPQIEVPISFSMLLNLVSVSNAHEKSVLWGFIRRYAPDASPERNPKLDELAGYAVQYFHAFVKPTKTYRAADETEREALEALVRLFAPAMPHLAEECWSVLAPGAGLVAQLSWLDHDPALAAADTVTIAVQVMGKLRATIEVPSGADEATVLAAAEAEENVARAIAGRPIRKRIHVPGKIVNLVL